MARGLTTLVAEAIVICIGAIFHLWGSIDCLIGKACAAPCAPRRAKWMQAHVRGLHLRRNGDDGDDDEQANRFNNEDMFGELRIYVTCKRFV